MFLLGYLSLPPNRPDFAQIDQIKDEICDALTSYSSRIEGFLKDMNECDRTCENLRDEIGQLRAHRMQMKANARCALTNKMVLPAGEPFYVFPSGYVYLESALKSEVMPRLNDKQRKRVTEVEEELIALRRTKSGANSADKKTKVDNLQAELDGLVAAECPLTGYMIVDNIDQGFPEANDLDEAFSSLNGGNSSSSNNGGMIPTASSSKSDAHSYVGVNADMATPS